jgi:hypothetical protein
MTFAKFALFDPIDVTARLHSMEQWVNGSKRVGQSRAVIGVG